MDKAKARELITAYCNAWVQNDSHLFSSVLHNEAVVRECTGSVMEGKVVLQQWFSDWNSNRNKVDYWTIQTFGYDGGNLTAFVEWEFKCEYKSKEYEWNGCSIVYFKDHLISGINEYEMTKKR